MPLAGDAGPMRRVRDFRDGQRVEFAAEHHGRTRLLPIPDRRNTMPAQPCDHLCRMQRPERGNNLRRRPLLLPRDFGMLVQMLAELSQFGHVGVCQHDLSLGRPAHCRQE